MKSNKKSNISSSSLSSSLPSSLSFNALMTAAMALPIVAIPLTFSSDSHAQTAAVSVPSPAAVMPAPSSTAAPESSSASSSTALPIGAVIGVRALYYRESGNRMKVTEPIVWFKSPVGENWEISASGTVDIVSGASAIIVSNQSGKPAQIYTGASISDRRTAGDVAVKRRIGESTFSVSRTQSSEKDYRSDATGANATFDFNERNTTLAIGYGRSNDRVRSVVDPLLNERRDSREYLFGVTQLLDRYSLVQTNLAYTKGSGYLNDPYRLTFSILPTGSPGPRFATSADLRPNQREQWAWLTRYKRTLQAQQAVVSAEYRFYRDDWGVVSHTLGGSWLQTVNDKWKVEFALRYYSQGKADFYRPEFTSRPLPEFTSSDQRLASFGSLEPTLKAIYQLNDAGAIDVGFTQYRQQGNWKFGGGGTTSFEPLQAFMVNAGYTHRF